MEADEIYSPSLDHDQKLLKQSYQKQVEKQQHQQLQEQIQQLKQILEQQKKEQEEKDQLPLLEQNHCFDGRASTNKLSALIPLQEDQVRLNDESTLFHNNLGLYSSTHSTLEVLQPLQSSLLKADGQHDHQFSDTRYSSTSFLNQSVLSSTENQSQPSYQSQLSYTSVSNENLHDKAQCQKLESSHEELQLCEHSESSYATSTDSAPPKITLIGPEILSRCQKKVVKRKAFLSDDVVRLSLMCEWHTCTDLFSEMRDYVKHVEKHIYELGEQLVCLWRYCGNQFPEQGELVRHLYYHSFHTNLKRVGQALQHSNQLQLCLMDTDGRNLVPQIPEPFECQWEDCEAVFVAAPHFYWHMETHGHCATAGVRDDKTVYACGWQGCTMTFSKITRVKQHARSHSQEKVVSCPHCGAIFASRSRYFDHLIKQQPLKAQLFQCSCCSRRFPNERLAKDHFRNHINTVKCPHCDMTCSSVPNLDAHILFRHSDVAAHQCPHCDRSFKRKSDLQRHLVTHTQHKLYRCNHANCDVKCRTYATVDKHIKAFHRNEKDVYACHVCMSEFSMGSTLSRHLIVGHKFSLPSGHKRFLYRRDGEGKFRLQTVRFESLELAQGVDKLALRAAAAEDTDSPAVEDGSDSEQEVAVPEQCQDSDSPDDVASIPAPTARAQTARRGRRRAPGKRAPNKTKQHTVECAAAKGEASQSEDTSEQTVAVAASRARRKNNGGNTKRKRSASPQSEVDVAAEEFHGIRIPTRM